MKGITEREGIYRPRAAMAYLGVLAALLASGVNDTRAAAAGGALPATAHASVAGVPLNFEPNVGQAQNGAQFLAHGPAYAVSLSAEGATLAGDGSALRLHVLNSRDSVTPTAEQPLAGVVNYYKGNDPKRWLTGIKTYGKVRYAGVYPGVDLVYYGTQGRLEYDFAVAAGASAKPIRLAVEGADHVRLDHGGLMVEANGHEVAFEHPVAYQLAAGLRVPVAASYKLSGNTVRFEVGAYDHSKQLIIDPVLSYFSYLGGSNNDVIGTGSPSGSVPSGYVSSQAAAVDAAGDLFVVGYTQSSDFPTQAAYEQDPAKSSPTNPTGFVTKFAPDGKSLIFSTYLGGTNGFDYAYAVALDSSGNAFVVGSAASNDFPITAGAYQTLCSPIFNNNITADNCSDGSNNGQISSYVSKFSPTGALLASTFLGGASAGAAYAVAVDSSGRPYVAGTTYPGVFTTAAPYRAETIGFPTTTGAVLAAYQWCQSCNINGALQYDAFVSVLNPTLTTLVYSTLFGDDQGFTVGAWLGNTYGTAVTVDGSGNFYLAGYTADAYLPVTSTAVQPLITSCGQYYPNENVVNGNCGFVAKFSPVGGSSAPTLTYGTYLGHLPACCSSNFISGIAADAAGDAYVVGYASVATFPTTSGAYQTTCDQYPTVNDVNCGSAFIAKLNPTGTTLLASTYFGGYYAGANNTSDNVSTIGGIALDKSGNVYIAGTASNGLPQVNGFAITAGSVWPFVAELNSALTSLVFSTLINDGGVGQVNIDGLALDTAGNIYLAGSIIPGTSAATSGAFQAANAGGGADGWVAKITVTTTTTTTTLTSSAATATTGTAVNLTAKVAESGGTAVPAGTVTFKDGSTTLGTMTLNGTGVAVYTASTLAVGAHSITAVYGGDSANGASTSAAVSVTVSAPPVPTVTIAVAPTSIVLGKSTTLTWSSTNATACTASNGWTGTQTVSGTQSVTPPAVGSLSYVLTCTGSGGSANATAALTVTTPAPTVTISAAPTSSVLGKTATLTWSSTNATACTASGSWNGSEAVSGSATVTPTAAGALSYVLTCTGTGGSANATAALTVTTPAPSVTISVSPTTITAGQAATLTWSSTNATACTATGAWSGTQATSGTASESPTSSGTSSYTLTCTGSGGSGNATAALTVNTGGKSGGGALGLWELLSLACLSLYAYRRRIAAIG